MAQKQVQFITMHSEEFQTKVVQSKGWLTAIVCCIMMINDLWDWSMDQSKVPSYGQGGYIRLY